MLIHIIRFTVKRESRSEHNFVIRAALGIETQGSLMQQAALDRSMKLWSDMLNFSPFGKVGEKGSGRCRLYKVLTWQSRLF